MQKPKVIPIDDINLNITPSREDLFALGWEVRNKEYSNSLGTLDPEITAACDHKCEHCWADLTGKHMKLEKFKEILNFAKSQNIGTLQFTGGEPTLNPEFLEMARLAKNEGFELILRTHGRNLPKPASRKDPEGQTFAEAIAECFDEIVISIDGAAEENFAMRPAKNFDRSANKSNKAEYLKIATQQYDETIAGLQAMSDAIRQRDNDNVKLKVNSVIAKKNFFAMGKFGRELQSLKDSGVKIDRWDMTEAMPSFFSDTLKSQYLLEAGEFTQSLLDATMATTDIAIKGKGRTSARCLIADNAGRIYVGGSTQDFLGTVCLNSDVGIGDNVRNSRADKKLAQQRNVSYIELKPHNRISNYSPNTDPSIS